MGPRCALGARDQARRWLIFSILVAWAGWNACLGCTTNWVSSEILIYVHRGGPGWLWPAQRPATEEEGAAGKKEVSPLPHPLAARSVDHLQSSSWARHNTRRACAGGTPVDDSPSAVIIYTPCWPSRRPATPRSAHPAPSLVEHTSPGWLPSTWSNTGTWTPK